MINFCRRFRMMAVKMIGKAAHVDRALRLDRIHLVGRRREHDVDAGSIADALVGVERAGIAAQIVLAVELQRVDEDAHDDDLTIVARRIDQPHVSRMKRAHCGN